MSGGTLITGASGFAGQHLVAHLAGRVPVVAWRHARSGRPKPPETPGVKWQPLDVLDRDAVVQVISRTRPSHIYHLAGAARVDTSWQSIVPHLETNVRGTHNIFEAIRRAHYPCRVLVVTSAMIYKASDEPISEDAPLAPASPYGLSKLAQDHLAIRAHEEDGLEVVIARSFNHAGPRQDAAFALSNFARQIARIEAGLAAPEIQVGNLDARRDVTDVRDVVVAYERLMEHAPAGRPYNVCSGRASRIGDLLEQLRRLSRVPVKITVDPSRLRPDDVPVVCGDPTRIYDEIGWTSQISIEQLLRDTLDWWRAETKSHV